MAENILRVVNLRVLLPWRVSGLELYFVYLAPPHPNPAPLTQKSIDEGLQTVCTATTVSRITQHFHGCPAEYVSTDKWTYNSGTSNG